MIVRLRPLRNIGATHILVPKQLRYRSSSSLGSKPLVVLALESSADDSSCAIVSATREILGLCTISQHAQNSLYGGIHPLKAQNSHAVNIPLAIERALKQSGLEAQDVDAIAYTRGPGMRGCLSIGEMAAKGLASGLGKRLVGVHHMQAHALTPLLTEPDPPRYPFLILLVSGGHTQLVLAESQERFQILLDTLDSKIGDAFEKAARFLQLPSDPLRSPGAILERYASLPPLSPYDSRPHHPLPIPLSSNTSKSTVAFSFAGLLSALERFVASGTRSQGASEGDQREYSRLFQEAAVSHLVLKLRQAIGSLDTHLMKKIDGLVVSGGVASNMFLRSKLEDLVQSVNMKEGRLYYPPIKLCTDNAAMIAFAAICRLQSGLRSDPYDLPLRPRWSLEDLYDDVPGSAYQPL